MGTLTSQHIEAPMFFLEREVMPYAACYTSNYQARWLPISGWNKILLKYTFKTVFPKL